jgi:nitroimidazol reductase NimA-like FMN-containing flavoprotein (pyridoxamine 5'-phosphate oxidase superfamily)
MRRKDKEVTDIENIELIINSSDVCRVAFADNNMPYIVTMNFGYSASPDQCLYFHSATEGRKLEMIKRNNHVCFEMDTDHKLYSALKACDWGMKFKSVVGYGNIHILSERDDKIRGLNCIMSHYSEGSVFEYDEKMLEKTLVIRLDIKEMTGKKR